MTKPPPHAPDEPGSPGSLAIEQDVPRSDLRLHDYLHRWAAQDGTREAVVTADARLTYAMLKDAVDACACGLIAAGAKPGDRIATLTVPGLDFLVTFLASASVGCIWVGLNPRYTDLELTQIVDRVSPKLVFSRTSFEDRQYGAWLASLPASIHKILLDEDVGELSAGVGTSFGKFLEKGGATSSAELAERLATTQSSDTCLIVFTSGSTGQPKGVMISHGALVGASEVQLKVWPAAPLRILNNLPINHIGCVGDISCYALIAGGTILFSERFEPNLIPRFIRDEGITVWGQVPTMFQLTLDGSQFDPSMLASLQLIFWGGAHASAMLIERLHAICPRIATSYGQTETVGSVTFTAPDTPIALLHDTVGRAVSPYQIRIVDEAGNALPVGKAGEIAVKTPYGMNGYWNGPDQRPELIAPDLWHRTGDVGVLNASGELALRGRVHDVFKSGGYNLYPAEIEAELEAHPDVRQAAVIGVDDRVFGTVAVAFIVPAHAHVDGEDLRGFLRKRLANYKIPKRFSFLEDLPRLPVGKVDKIALKRLWEAS